MNVNSRVIGAAVLALGSISLGTLLLNSPSDSNITVSTPVQFTNKLVGIRPLIEKHAKFELPSITRATMQWTDKKVHPNINSLLRFGPVKVNQNLVTRIVKAAKKADMNPALLMAIAEKESNFDTKIKAKTSSATGLFQFIDKTWLKAIHLYGSQYSQSSREKILSLRADPYLSTLFAAKMLKSDSEGLADKIGRKLTAGETYLIHFLGSEDAERFMQTLKAAPQSSAAALLPKPAQANRPIFYAKQGHPKTVAEVRDAFESMMGSRFRRYQNVAAKLPAGVTAYTE